MYTCLLQQLQIPDKLHNIKQGQATMRVMNEEPY